MSAATVEARTVVVPAGKSSRHAVSTVEALHRFMERQHESLSLLSPDGSRVDVPVELFGLLHQAAEIMARGDGVSIHAVSRELTTTEAAGLLGMSRPTLIRLLDSGQIPAHRVGTHRRVRLTDALEFRTRRLREQRKAYEDLMLECDALGIDGD